MLSFQDRRTDVSRGNSVSRYKNDSELPGGSFTAVFSLTATQKMTSMSEEMTREGENMKCVKNMGNHGRNAWSKVKNHVPFHSQSTHVNLCNMSMSC